MVKQMSNIGIKAGFGFSLNIEARICVISGQLL